MSNLIIKFNTQFLLCVILRVKHSKFLYSARVNNFRALVLRTF